MSDLLLVLLVALAVPNWIVTGTLIRAAIQEPRIPFLTATSVGSFLVSLGIGAYVVAVLNARADFIIPESTARIAFRLVLVGVALFPFWWLWLYRTGRFRE